MSASSRPFRVRAEERLGELIVVLPDSVLRRMGGGAFVIDGRTLDPRLHLAARTAAGKTPISEMTPDRARAAANFSLARSNGPRAAGVSVEGRIIDHRRRARVYRPERASSNHPGMLFMHQGGFVIGDLLGVMRILNP